MACWPGGPELGVYRVDALGAQLVAAPAGRNLQARSAGGTRTRNARPATLLLPAVALSETHRNFQW